MTAEIFGYEISKEGIVKGKNGVPLNPGIKNGYMFVIIFYNGTRKNSYVHRLVAEKYIPNPENKKQVNHINGDKFDNRVCNLEWVTCKENISHAWESGLCEKTRNSAILNTSNHVKIEYRTPDGSCFTSAMSAANHLGISKIVATYRFKTNRIGYDKIYL